MTEGIQLLVWLGIAAIAVVWWYSDTVLARRCDRCGGAKEPSSRWCAPCEGDVPEWLM